MAKEEVEKGIIVSRRKVIPVGGSKAITLSKKWLDIQKWLGKEVTELVSVADDAIVLVPVGKEEKAKKILAMLEEGRT